MNTSFLQHHYEKLILAVFLILFVALLYFQLTVIQDARDKEVDQIVNQKEREADYKKIDYTTHPRFRMDTIFSNQHLQWVFWKNNDPKSIEDLMTPMPLAICPHCYRLVPASGFPPKGSQSAGMCILCKKQLKPRTSDIQIAEEVPVSDDADNNGLPDKWEEEYKILGTKDVDPDKDGFTNQEEYQAKTNPVDATSHPLYVTKLKLAQAPKTEQLEALLAPHVKKDFSGTIRLKDVSAESSDPSKWEAEFSFKTGKKVKTLSYTINEEILYRMKTSNDKVLPSIGFRLVEVKDAKKAKDRKAVIERITDVGGEKLRMECSVGKPIMTPYALIVFENQIDHSRIETKTGAEIQLGSEKTGLEKYKVISVEGSGNASEVILEDVRKQKWPVRMTVPVQTVNNAASATANQK